MNIYSRCRIIRTDGSSTTISISDTNFLIINVKISSCSFKGLEIINNFYIVDSICIFKNSKFVVRKIRYKYIWCIIFVTSSVRICIKNRKCWNIATTSNSENTGSFDTIIFWIWNIKWTNLCLTKIISNEGCATGDNYSTMNTIQFIECIVIICNIKICCIWKFTKICRSCTTSKSIIWCAIRNPSWTVINYMFSRIKNNGCFVKSIVIKSSLVWKSRCFD